MFSKDMIAEEQKFQFVKSFLEEETVRLAALIEECRQDVRAQGEDFNMDNPNGGMYSGMELTQIHYEMEKKMQCMAESANTIAFYDKIKKRGRVIFYERNKETVLNSARFL